MPAVPPDEQWRILSAGAEEIIPADELRTRLDERRPLRVKLGMDPTAEHVTLGWAVPLRKLRQFQDLGHTAVLIVGDFTARIGDPSEQSKTRRMLSKDEVDAYVNRVLDQFKLILSEERLVIRRNSEWLEPLGVEGILRLGANYTVAQMLQRNDFAERFEARQPISITEFLYPLLQAYDSVAVESDVELGGTDQTFNLLVGRDVQQRFGVRPQVVLTMPLLEGTDGVQKMSQSLGNYIAITEPSDEMFGKLMRVPDGLMPKYFRLATDLGDDEIDVLLRDARPEHAKRRLAREVVRIYHGPQSADAAAERFDRLFVHHDLPADVPERELPPDAVSDGTVHLPLVLKEIFSVSTTEARRLIGQGGVRIDGERVDTEDVPLQRIRGTVIQLGKRRFARIR